MLAFIGFVVGTVAVGVAAWCIARRSARGGVGIVAFLLAAICAKTALAAFPHWEWWLFPWPGYAFVQQLALYPIAAMFFGVAVTRLPLRWNRAVVALVGLGVVAHGARENAWLAWPGQHGRAIHADVNHHLQQSTHYTCGPAACVAAASHCGVEVLEVDMARDCLTHAQGSRLFNLYRGLVIALHGQPFAVSIRALDAAELLEPGRITVVANGGGGHALCIVGCADHALVHDPLDKAPKTWELDELRRSYTPPAVVVEARADDRAAAAPR